MEFFVHYLALAQFVALEGSLSMSGDLQASSVQLFVLVVLGLPALLALMRRARAVEMRYFGLARVPVKRRAVRLFSTTWRLPSAPGIRGAVLVRAPAVGHDASA